MIDIIIAPDEIEEYFKDNYIDLLRSMHLIASNDEFGIEVYLTSQTSKKAKIEVLADDISIYSVEVAEGEISDALTDVYDKYLTNYVQTAVSQAAEQEQEEEEQELIELRGLELLDAFVDLLSIVLDNCETDGNCTEIFEGIDDIAEACMGDILHLLYEKYGFSVYHPMYLEFDDSKEVEFVEYPYPYLEPDKD